MNSGSGLKEVIGEALGSRLFKRLNKEPDIYWVVWCPSERPPSFRHDNYESAYDESIRLADLNPGKEFHVLELRGVAYRYPKKVMPDAIYLETDDIPF